MRMRKNNYAKKSANIGWAEGDGGAGLGLLWSTWAARRVRSFWLATIISCSLLIKTKLSAHTHTYQRERESTSVYVCACGLWKKRMHVGIGIV